MFKATARTALTNLSVILVMVGIALLVSDPSGMALRENGRFTDFACYLFIGAVFVALAYVARVDYMVKAGKVDENTLPRFLRNTY